MNTEAQYNKLILDLTLLESRLNAAAKAKGDYLSVAYLTDTNVDAENVPHGVEIGSDEYWDDMYRSAAMAAGMRGEDLGIDVNAELGYIVY